MGITVVIADDQAALRAGVRAVLDEDPAIEVVAEASDGMEALDLVLAHQPDVAVLDVAMPRLTGIEVAAKLREAGSQAKVLGLSMHADSSYVQGMLNAGALGYVLKDCAAEELADAIHAVLAGERYLSSDLQLDA